MRAFFKKMLLNASFVNVSAFLLHKMHALNGLFFFKNVFIHVLTKYNYFKYTFVLQVGFENPLKND